MNSEQIYVIGEMLILNELNVKNVSYPEEENPAYCIVELDNGIVLKLKY